MQTIEDVKRHCREVGEGIAAAVAAGEDLGKRFEGVQSITFRIEKDGSEIADVRCFGVGLVEEPEDGSGLTRS